MKATIIIQARMGSSRLPGKVMYELKNKPILWHIVERLKKGKYVNDIILATSTSKEDDKIEEFAKKNNIKYIRGSEDDVLSRYVEAAKITENDILVRITSDCPLIDPKIVDKCIKHFIETKCDYVAPTCKNGILRGLDTEVFSKSTLIEINKLAKMKNEREHVTLYIYSNPDKYNVDKLVLGSKYEHPKWRLCVDEIGDYNLINAIYNELYIDGEIIKIEDVIDFLSNNERLLKLNENVEQKKI